MCISDRCIGKQVLFGTLFAVLALSLVLVLGNLFNELRPLLVDSHAPLPLVFRLVMILFGPVPAVTRLKKLDRVDRRFSPP